MIHCPAYGLAIMTQQCDAARGRFWLERICAGCGREEVERTVLILEKAPAPIPFSNIPKSKKPRRKCPPGMTPAVARAMGFDFR